MLNIVLWVATGLLALIALAGGVTKTFVDKEKLAAHDGGRWTRDASRGFVRTLGILEMLAAVGLTLPAITGILPVLVPVTAICWVLLMIGAMITHGRLGQRPLMLLNLIYLLLAAFIAGGRLGPGAFPGQ